MEIDINLPYVHNGPSPEPVDALVLKALLDTFCEKGSTYLQSRPQVKPYRLGTTHGRIVVFHTKTFHPDSSEVDDSIMLRALLSGLIAANHVYLKYLDLPSLYKSGVIYKRTRIWDSLPALYARGYGDCKTLTAARIAELQKADKKAEPLFRFMPRNDGHKNFHILLQTYRGYEDPSRKLGMGKNENAYFR